MPGLFLHFLAHFGNVKTDEKIGFEKSAPGCPIDRGGRGGRKLFGNAPWKQHIS